MPRFYFEDFTPGQTIEHGPRLITREEIVAFAAQFDPQPMHLDEDAGRKSLLGGLGASGWHSCGIMMRMIYDAVLHETASMGAAIEPRRRRLKMGIVHWRYEMYNAHGERVMTMVTPSMMYRRNPGAPS